VRIGLSGGGASIDRMVEQARTAEADGFSSLWYAGAVSGDPLAAMAIVGRATGAIELGTSVLQTYPTHPLAMANRAAGAAAAIGRPGFTLGLGPSHAPVIEGVYGYSYDRPGTHTEEYARIVCAALRGETVDFTGEVLSAHGLGRVAAPEHPVPVLLGALAPRLLRVAGEVADGTITWMANARAVADHVSPLIRKAAAGRDVRIVVGLPVCVHDDEAEARAEAATQFAIYAGLPNYQRILAVGGAPGPADAAIVGDERSVTAQITAIFDAGATDVWLAPFPVGDRNASRARTRTLLNELARA